MQTKIIVWWSNGKLGKEFSTSFSPVLLWKSGENFIVKLWLNMYRLRPIAGENEENKEQKKLLKWGKFSFYVILDCQIVTYLKNKE